MERSCRMEAVLEEEEGFDAIVQSKSIALRKIRRFINVGGSGVVFIIGQLANGGVFVGVIVVSGRELTESRRTVVDGRRASM